MDAVTVTLAVEHPSVRAGVRAVLGHLEGVEVAGETATLRGAVALLRSGQPDVLVLGSRFEGESSVDALVQLAYASPNTRIVMLSMNDSADYARHVVEAGAAALVRTDRVAEDLEPQLHAAAREHAHA